MSDEISLSKPMIRAVLFYDFKLGINAAESSRRICTIGEETISVRCAQDWFQRFRSDDFCLEDRSRSGRPSDFDDDRLRQFVESDSHLTSREISALMGVTQPTIIARVHAIGKMSKLDQWVPHKLSDFDRKPGCSSQSQLNATGIAFMFSSKDGKK